MKRLLILGLIFICTGFTTLNNSYMLEIFALSEKGEVTFFFEDFTLIENIKLNDYTVIRNGAGVEITTSVEQAEEDYYKLSRASGIMVSFERECVDIAPLLISLDVAKSEFLGEYEVYYLYTSKLYNTITLDGKKVNLQLVITPSHIILGTPIILGSY